MLKSWCQKTVNKIPVYSFKCQLQGRFYNAGSQLGAYILGNSNFSCCVYVGNWAWKIDFGITSKV